MGRARARHVVKSVKGWAVRAPGAKRASVTTRKQSTAVTRARKILKNLGGGSSASMGGTAASGPLTRWKMQAAHDEEQRKWLARREANRAEAAKSQQGQAE